MLRRLLKGATTALALYLLVYIGLSATGSYHRFTVSLVGPTIADEWLPRGFTHPTIVTLFLPAYIIDSQLWHPLRPEPGWHYTQDKSGSHMTRPDSQVPAVIPKG